MHTLYLDSVAELIQKGHIVRADSLTNILFHFAKLGYMPESNAYLDKVAAIYLNQISDISMKLICKNMWNIMMLGYFNEELLTGFCQRIASST